MTRFPRKCSIKPFWRWGPFLVADFRLEYPRDSTPSRPRAQSLNSVFRAATMFAALESAQSCQNATKNDRFLQTLKPVHAMGHGLGNSVHPIQPILDKIQSRLAATRSS
jgi:hypothetical protein